MPELKQVVWAQEEPQNNGAWTFVEPLIEACLAEAGIDGHAARNMPAAPSSASPATGLAKRHAARTGGLDCRRRSAIASRGRARPAVAAE